MKTKKILGLIASFALVAAIAVGGTLAYLQMSTNTITNSFSSSKGITGTLTEPGWTGDDITTDGTWKDYLPNETHAKDPIVTLTSSNTNAYIAIKVEFNANGSSDITYDAFKAYADVKTGTSATAATSGFNTTNWEEVEVDGENYKLFIYKTTLTTGATNPLFNFVQVNKDIATVDGKLPNFNIVTSGYAVQADEITKDEAISTLKTLAAE